jgi:hypothetical protein
MVHPLGSEDILDCRLRVCGHHCYQILNRDVLMHTCRKLNEFRAKHEYLLTLSMMFWCLTAEGWQRDIMWGAFFILAFLSLL